MTALIPRDFARTVLERLDIVEVISTRLSLKKSGQVYLGLCPFHQEKTPSMNISRRKQLFHCFGCGVGGDLITFLMQYDDADFMTVLSQLAEQVGLPLPSFGSTPSSENYPKLYQTMEYAVSFYQNQLENHIQKEKAILYVKKRGLNKTMIQRYRIGFAPPGWQNLIQNTPVEEHTALLDSGLIADPGEGKPTYDRFRDRLIFPIRNLKGHIVGLGGRTLGKDKAKYLNSPETAIFHKNQVLYGLYEAVKTRSVSEQIIVVEGYMDVISLAQRGILCAVATLGTQISEAHLKLLMRYTPNLIFCFDGDKAGQKAAWRALEISLPQITDKVSIQFMFLPAGDDPDTFIKSMGKEAFLAQKKNSLPLSTFLIQTLQEQHNLQSVDGKSQFLTAFKPLMQKIPRGAFRAFLIQAIAQKLDLSSQQFKDLWTNQSFTPASSSSLPIKQPLQAKKLSRILKPGFSPLIASKTSHCIQLIQYLLQQPNLIKHLTNLPRLKLDQGVPESKFLYDIIHFLKENPKLSLEELKAIPEINIPLTYYLSLPSLVVPNDPDRQAAFCDTWCHLVNQQLETIIQQLLEKASLMPLSHEETLSLYELIEQKQKNKQLT